MIWSHAITPEPRIYSVTRAENKMKHNSIKNDMHGLFFFSVLANILKIQLELVVLFNRLFRVLHYFTS